MSFKPWQPKTLTWFITGASSGFGLALARIALLNGHSVIATSRDPARNPSLVSEFQAAQGRGRWMALDVNDPECASVIHNLEAEGVEIDVLVNNAGYAILGPAETFTEDEIRQQMETIFFGPSRLIRAAVSHMRPRRRGMVVNLGSGAGLDGRDGMAVYGGAKAALDGFMRVAAKELSIYNIRSLNVQLGAFNTNFTNSVITSSASWPDDYNDAPVSAVVNAIKSPTWTPDGDHLKASKVIYDIVLGEGAGLGKEGERVLPLGRDLEPTMNSLIGSLSHSMDVFREICNNVYVEQ